MSIAYGFRKVKVFENVPANTLTQVDEFFGAGGFGYIEVTNVNVSDSLRFTVNVNPNGGQPGMTIPINVNREPTGIPMLVTNFIANDVVTVVAYGN